MTPTPRPPSDLVRDSKIEAEVLGTGTKHVFYAPGNSARERQVRKEERWVREEYLGQGAFGTVYRERCEEGERKDMVRAVKEIKKRVAAGEELDYTRELEAIVKFSNPRYSHCFVRSDGWFETTGSVFISMEYLELGDLQTHLSRPLYEADARDITVQVLEGLQIMHDNGFVHRDLKPGNIMVVAKRPWYVKIADFGISKRRLDDVTSLRTFQRGTFGFAAPEIFELGSGPDAGSYTSAVDMWSLGAVVHKILVGAPPFQGLSELYKYTTGIDKFPMADLQEQGISENGRNFISTLMSPDPKNRPTAAGAAQHPWMTMELEAPEDDIIAVEPNNEMYVNEVTVTTASGCWTFDHTVTKLPFSAPTVRRVSPNYQPPRVEDCPVEPDTDPSSCLPKDSAVLMEEIADLGTETGPGPLADGHLLSPESKNSASATTEIPTDIPTDTPVDTAAQTSSVPDPENSAVNHGTASASEISSIEPILNAEGNDHKLAELKSSYPRIASAYNALLNAIHNDSPDLQTSRSLLSVLGSNLKLRGVKGEILNNSESAQHPETANTLPFGGNEDLKRLVSCYKCKGDALPLKGTAELPCGHRMCHSCLKRVFRLSVKDPLHAMPPHCCKTSIPLNHVVHMFDDDFKRKYNTSLDWRRTHGSIPCPSDGCREEIVFNKHQVGGLYCATCGLSACRDCARPFHRGPCLSKTVSTADNNFTGSGENKLDSVSPLSGSAHHTDYRTPTAKLKRTDANDNLRAWDRMRTESSREKSPDADINLRAWDRMRAEGSRKANQSAVSSSSTNPHASKWYDGGHVLISDSFRSNTPNIPSRDRREEQEWSTSKKRSKGRPPRPNWPNWDAPERDQPSRPR